MSLIWLGPDTGLRINAKAIRTMDPATKALVDALAVFILDSKIRRLMLAHDPQAFQQAVDAMILYGAFDVVKTSPYVADCGATLGFTFLAEE
jgi:hypothetical protein